LEEGPERFLNENPDAVDNKPIDFEEAKEQR
jgi:hypothetical protein